jgi:YbgC/YbaW family acyl-CoA thioester hydrolase
MFVYHVNVKMHHIDAAGVMFFGQFFYLAHDAYESFLEEISFAVKDILQQDFLIPLTHAAADYQAPVKLGDTLTVELLVEKIGQTSFTVSYRISNQLDRLVAGVKTVHTTISRQTRQPIDIPPTLREALQRFRP